MLPNDSKTHVYISTPPPVEAKSESLHSLLDISPDALVVVNQIGTIVMVNAQAEALFGYAPEEIRGQRLEVLLPERFHALHQVQCQHYFSAPRPRPLGAGFQLFGKRKDGTEFSADISLRPLLLDEVLHVIAAVRDLTWQKRIEEELQEQYRSAQEASRLKSEFLANMSHELRTPLNAIIGFTEMMYDGVVGQTSEAQHEYLGDILSSSRHLLQLINDVLDLARVEAGKMIFSPEEVDLERLVAEVRDILRILIASKRIRFEAEIDPALHGVVIDPAKLKQVLYNYLSNALKFTPDEGRVTVRIRPEGDDAFLLEVEDSGNGILPEDTGRLFVEFQQLDAGMAKKHQGTGLGLALTRRIVEAQGGSVGVRSVPGQGSTFFAALPRVNQAIEEFAAQESKASWDPPPFSPQEGTPTILVIEDDPRDRRWLVSSFSEAGYAVESAATATDALEFSQKRAFDVITLDLLLPDASGWDVLRSIRAGGPNRNAPIVVVTLVTEKNVARSLPVQDMLSKPVQLKELLASLERARSVTVANVAGLDGSAIPPHAAAVTHEKETGKKGEHHELQIDPGS